VKQIAQFQDGRLKLQDVPIPTAPRGGVLARTTHSVISVGTERMKVEQARMNLLQKARARPDQVRKVLDTARTRRVEAGLDLTRFRGHCSPWGRKESTIWGRKESTMPKSPVGRRGAEAQRRLDAFGYILRADQVLRDVPDGAGIGELAERLRRWNVKYVLTENPRPHRRGQATVGQRFDALLALGEFREVASYPADFGPWRALPQRRVVLYERAAPLAFDPAAPPPRCD
jgi:hypothetical protein